MPALRTSLGGVLEYLFTARTPLWTPITIPAGISHFRVRPDWTCFKGDTYLAGQFSRVLRIDESNTAFPLGILPPPTPTLAAGAGDITGEVFVYLTFGHRAPNGRLIAESNPSRPSATVSLVAQGRTTGNVPTTSPDRRVNVVRCYASVDGLDGRLAWERELSAAVTSVTESLHTLALGELLSSTHGVPPYASMIARYHERLWMVDPAKPYRLWYTEFGEGEYVASTNFIDLPGREGINGIGECNDILMVQGSSCSYSLQGYEATDFDLTKISPTVGTSAPRGGKDIGDRRLFPCPMGIVLWNGGAFVNTLQDDLSDYWIADYKANQAAYENAVAEVDDAKGLYYLQVTRLVGGVGVQQTVRWVGSYDQKVFGSPSSAAIEWSLDLLDRDETAIGKIADAGSHQPVMVFGAGDGYARKEDPTDDGDDGDDYNKKWVVELGHDYFEDVGGDKNHGKSHIEHTVFLKNETRACLVSLYAGGNSAPSALPKKTKTIPVGAIALKAARDFYTYQPLISGEGLTRRFEIENPVGIEFYGDAGVWIDGTTARPATA